MKNTSINHRILIFIIIAILVSACVQPLTTVGTTPQPSNTATLRPQDTATSNPTSTSTSKATVTSTSTSTVTPTATNALTSPPTFTPTSAPIAISAANVGQIQELARYGSARIYKVAFSGDGNRIFAFTADGVKVYDTSYNLVKEVNGIYVANDSSAGFFASKYFYVSANRDGNRLALVSLSSPGYTSAYGPEAEIREYQVLDLDAGKIFAQKEATRTYFPWVALSPDGRLFAYPAEADNPSVGRWQVVDLSTGNILYQWHGKYGAFSSNGQVFAAEVESQLYFWNTSDWKEITNIGLGRLADGGWCWTLSPDGSSVAIAAQDHVNIWNAAKRDLVRSINLPYISYPYYLAFTSDGQSITVEGSTNNGVEAFEWSIADGQPIKLASSPDSAAQAQQKLEGMQLNRPSYLQPVLVFADNDIEIVDARWVDITSANLEFTYCHIISGSCSVIDGAAGIIASQSGDLFSAWLLGGGDVVFRKGVLSSDQAIYQTNIGDSQYMTLLGVSPKENYLVYSTYGTSGASTVHLINLSTGRKFSEFVVGALWSNSGSVVFSQEGSRIAVIPGVFAASEGGKVLVIYDLLNEGTILYRRDRQNNDSISSGMFTLEGNFAFNYFSDNWRGIKLIDPLHRKVISEYKSPTNYCTPAVYSRDGSLAVCSDATGNITLLNGSWDHITTWKAHMDLIRNVTFSADNRYLATSGADGYLKIWGIVP